MARTFGENCPCVGARLVPRGVFLVLVLALAAAPGRAQSLIFSHLAGSSGGPGSNDGAYSVARFNAPMGVAIDAAGALYIADSWNQTIRKIDGTGVSTLAGLAGQKGWSNGTGPHARFIHPRGIAIDAAGNLYVTDALSHTIRKVTPTGVVTTLAGSPGESGSIDGTGAGARFNRPLGIAVHGTTVYVADRYNCTIRQITAAGVVTTLAGLGCEGGGVDGTGSAARFSYPAGLAVDGAGTLFVADNQTIRRVTPAGVVTTFAGQYGQSGSVDGTGSAARFKGVMGIVADAAGTLYVTDIDWTGSRLRRVTAAGVVTTLAGADSGYVDGPASAARLWGSTGLAVDSFGGLYIADTWNHAIRHVGLDLSFSTTAGHAGRSGSADGTGDAALFGLKMGGSWWSSDDIWYEGPGEGPGAGGGIAVDDVGNVYVADNQNSTIRRITPAGAVTTLAGLPGQSWVSKDGVGSAAWFANLAGLAVDRLGNVYVADWVPAYGGAVRKITPAGSVTTLAGVADQQGSTDGTGSLARFFAPRGIAVDRDGNLYVADTHNCTIRKVTAAGLVTTLAGSAGQIGSTDGLGSAARFYTPRGVAVDALGTIYVADTYNCTIRTITPAGLVTTLAGQAGQCSAVDGQGTSSRFGYPTAVEVDDAGNVYVADHDGKNDARRHLIRKVTPTGMVTTVAGGMMQTADGTGGAARFRIVFDVATDRAGNVYALDGYSVRKGIPGPRRFETYTPQEIYDQSTVDVPLAVSGVAGVVDRISVSVHLKHTWDGDLTLSLVGPDSTTVVLSARRGSGGDDYGTAGLPDALRTTFDDSGSTSIADAAAPFVGIFRPEGNLSAFAGKSSSGVNGMWVLRVQDSAGGDVGVVDTWSLDIFQRSPQAWSATSFVWYTSGGTMLTIGGAGFSTWPWPDVRIGGVPVTVTGVAGDGSWIQVVTPPSRTGQASLTVTNPDLTTAYLANMFVAIVPAVDFDRDRLSDVAVYRPGTGTWFWLKSSLNNQQLGYHGWGVQAHGDTPALGDYDGDGVVDPTVFRPSTGTWFILTSKSTYTDWMWFGWGIAGDVPVAGDYDGDGVSDGAVYRPSTGIWYIRPSSNPSAAWSVNFSTTGAVPMQADYDGDGLTDIAVYQASTGTWFILRSSSGYQDWEYHGWGVQALGDQPVPADYDGDGKADLAVYRPGTGTWFILMSASLNTQWTYYGWGQTGDVPVSADYNGDGIADAAVYRPATGVWYVRPSLAGTPWSVQFGEPGDVPLVKRQ